MYPTIVGCFCLFNVTVRPGESRVNRHVFCGPDGRPFPGRNFDIKWIRNHEVFFRDCDHIINSLNENKPVKIGRDGQELSYIAGRELCELIEAKYYGRCATQDIPVEDEMVPAHDGGGVPLNDSSLVGHNFSQSRVGDKRRQIPENVSTSDSLSSPKRMRLGKNSGSEIMGENIDSSNPLLKVFPLDLSQLTYDLYLGLYEKSQLASGNSGLPLAAPQFLSDWMTGTINLDELLKSDKWRQLISAGSSGSDEEMDDEEKSAQVAHRSFNQINRSEELNSLLIT